MWFKLNFFTYKFSYNKRVLYAKYLDLIILNISNKKGFYFKIRTSYLVFSINNTPRGSRIPVSSVKGRCPRPLDDGGMSLYCYNNLFL